MGRELTRLETRKDETASAQFSTAWSYDPLGRLASNQQQIGSHNWGFSYDGLGNMLTQFDPGAALGTPPSTRSPIKPTTASVASAMILPRRQSGLQRKL